MECDKTVNPVTTYYIPPEEIERRYGPVEPPKPKKDSSWPKVGQPNLRRRKQLLKRKS